MAPPVLVVEDEERFRGDLRPSPPPRVSHDLRRKPWGRARPLETESLALVIADLRLPDGDGLDVVRAARERRHPPPVIVVTAFASEESRRQALRAGATAYLAKPFSTSALTSLIQEVLAQSST